MPHLKLWKQADGFHSVKGIGSFIHPGVSLQTFTLLLLISAKNHKKRYKSTKAKQTAEISGMGERRGEGVVSTQKLRAPGDLLHTESCNILVASPKSEQGFPPVIQQRCKQLTKAFRQPLSRAQQPGGSFPLQMGEPRDQLSRTTGTVQTPSPSVTVRLPRPA